MSAGTSSYPAVSVTSQSAGVHVTQPAGRHRHPRDRISFQSVISSPSSSTFSTDTTRVGSISHGEDVAGRAIVAVSREIGWCAAWRTDDDAASRNACSFTSSPEIPRAWRSATVASGFIWDTSPPGGGEQGNYQAELEAELAELSRVVAKFVSLP